MRKSSCATATTALAAAVLVGCSWGNTDGGAAAQPADAPSSSESPDDVAEGGADSSESVKSTEPLSSQETPSTPNGTDWTGDLPNTLTFESALAHVHGAVLRDRSLLVATHDGLTSVDVVTGVTESVGDSRDDLMAFAQDPTGALFASGHAGPEVTTLGVPGRKYHSVERPISTPWLRTGRLLRVGQPRAHCCGRRTRETVGCPVR